MNKLLFSRLSHLRTDLLSGLTVALALVPEAVAFALVAGVHPLSGLYAAFMVGLITACLGGRPGMISGATGALAVVMVALVAQHGVEYLFAAVVLMGIIQIGCGLLRLGKFIRIVPYTVMLGFVNGLAIVIFLAQMQHFHTADGSWLQGQPLWIMLTLVGLTMAIIQFLPRFTRAIPASLAAILTVSVLAIALGLETKTVGDFSSIAGGLPTLHWPQVPWTMETLVIILPYSFIFAAIGLIESLLTMRVIDEITDTRGRGNKECVAQGVANTVTGCFGGMGGCAMIGQSMINVNSGGLGRASGISAAMFLLCFILFVPHLIEAIPLAALIGVMFMVVIGTFEWASFRLIRKIPPTDAVIGILVAVVTVATDLAVAVLFGVIASALVFAWQHAKRIYVTHHDTDHGSRVYQLHGPVFFGSIYRFNDLFQLEQDPDEVIIDFKYARVADHSAIEAIDALAERYTRAGKKLHLKHLSPECRKLLHKARDLVDVNIQQDPDYPVASDKLA